MKLGALCTVYNEASFLDYSIRSYIDYVDHVAIVEGSYKETIALGKPERSTDGTLEIINKYKSNPKVTTDHVNLQTDKDHRNVGLQRLKEAGCDFLLIVDGDEAYTQNTLAMVKALAKSMIREDKYAAYFRSITFVNDAHHYCDQDFPRLFRLSKECSFFNDNYMQWPDLGRTWNDQSVVRVPTISYHHYAFCKGADRFLTKKSWWESRFKNFNYSWYIDENGKINDTMHTIKEYKGKHPSVMLEHPLLRKENG